MIKTISRLKKIELSKANFKFLPKSPGIYIFWHKNRVIYIGKAINLKNRLNSYLQINLDLKTKRMLSLSEFVSFIKVENELEALLLEAYLIKKYQPKYNIIAKDDKNSLYIKITKEKYPRIITARKIDENKKDYISFFGPFPSSLVVKNFLRTLRKTFSYSDHKIAKKACIYNQIGLCDPCPSIIESKRNLKEKETLRKLYLSKIKIINTILNGNYRKIQKDLFNKMNKLAKEDKFEEASVVKNQLKSMEYITQSIVRPKLFSDNPNLSEDLINNQLKQLSLIINKIAGISLILNRIECYDVSHTSGTNTTASMAVFIKGQEDRKLYRHFKILNNKKNDDISSLKEVSKRRMKHLDEWGKPDLVIVDGGIAQTKTFYKEFSKEGIFVIGIAKRYETLIIPKIVEGKLVFKNYLLPNNPAKRLVQRLRDEAHRFAQRYHKILLKKTFFNKVA
ncbi:MAG: GIY-YIG nuclease family protein [Patescibacteria group bacterium]